MIGAVILAAGESRRMGRPKPLLPIEGKPLIQQIIETLSEVADELVVVLGHRPEDLIPVIEKLPAKYTINRRYQEGMASSFKAGLRELRGCDAVFLVLGDQPRVAHVFLRKAVKAWREGARIVSPVFKNRKGHPVLIDRSLFPEFLSLAKDGQIREVIEEHRDEHVLIKAGEWAVKDLDYPEDLAGLGKISKNPKTH